MRYTEIDRRIDGERRKYTKSPSAAATSVGPHTELMGRALVWVKLEEEKLSQHYALKRS